MKQESPARVKHLAKNTAEPVIHHYEEDQTLLARWVLKGLEKGASFWIAVLAAVAVVCVVGYLISNTLTGESESAKAWTDVMTARDVDDLEKVFGEDAKGPVALWSRLEAATARYQEGILKLPNDREGARPLLTQAIDWFREVEKQAGADGPLKRLAAMGLARTLEARNDLQDAIQEYDRVATTWPNTDEARIAGSRAKTLKSPAAIDFYAKFYAYRPSEVGLPPRSSSTFGGPNIPGLNPSDLLSPYSPPSSPGGESTPPSSGDGQPGAGELPKNPFESNPPPLPVPDAPPADAPKS